MRRDRAPEGRRPGFGPRGDRRPGGGRRSGLAPFGALLLVALLVGCGSDPEPEAPSRPPGAGAGPDRSKLNVARTENPDYRTPGKTGGQGEVRGEVLPPSSCPPDLSNCVVARGRVIYVEAVDPDGDGDAHFITASDQGVTLPGITIFDVREDLRPDPLPEVGDLIGGAGPIYPGSRGQRQIEVIEFNVAR